MIFLNLLNKSKSLTNKENLKKAMHFVFLLTTMVHLLIGMFWMAVLFSVVWLIFWMFTSQTKVMVRFRKISYLVYPMLFIGVLLAAITFKTLFFGIYTIPSGSMERTIVPGDIVWVNNLTYGPRLPYSPYEISWINILVWLYEGKGADIKKRWWNYNRLKGYFSPKRGDIAVFNHPHIGIVLIKRIVALPGDTLQIVKGQLLINGLEQTRPQNSIFYSKARFKNRNQAHIILDSLHINMFQKETLQHEIQFNGHITHAELQALKQHPQVIEASIDPCRPDTAFSVYPHSEHLNWNIDNYGPYMLPFKGMVIEKNPENLRVYGPLIDHEAQFRPESERDSCGHFRFYNDYYFIMGDNFHDSEDSRYFGPVKEELLIGKGAFFLYSKSNKKSMLSRFLRKLK